MSDAVLYTLLIGSMAGCTSTLVSWARTRGIAESWYDTGVILVPLVVGAFFALFVSDAWTGSQLVRVFGYFALCAPLAFVLIGIPSLAGGLVVISLNALIVSETARFMLPLFGVVALLWLAVLEHRHDKRCRNGILLVGGVVLLVLAVFAMLSSSADAALAVPDPMALLFTCCFSIAGGVSTALGEDTTRHGRAASLPIDADRG
jgi:hypothetical protein